MHAHQAIARKKFSHVWLQKKSKKRCAPVTTGDCGEIAGGTCAMSEIVQEEDRKERGK
jgi:hypothetical protein